MRYVRQHLLISSIIFGAVLCAFPVFGAGGKGNHGNKTTYTIDFNEETHLVFMREEEKLARDVYITLGGLYPDAIVFQNIDDAEQQHTTKVKDKLAQYGISDPNTDDTVGEFTGKDYGGYFRKKYDYLIHQGEISEITALYAGAFIEELDMLDIVQCPQVIQDVIKAGFQDQVDVDETSCGLAYTDNSDIQRVLENLLEGSKNHLRSYVGNIEAVEGKCTYVAQVLEQKEVDAILGRVGECGFIYK